MFYSEHVETKEITVKLPQIILKLNETYLKSMFDWNSISSPVRNEGVT